MSQSDRDNDNVDTPEENQLVKREHKEEESSENPTLYFLTESVLIVGGIPSIIMFFVAVVTGLILLIQEDNYLKCIIPRKALSNDVDDRMENHLNGSMVVAFALVIIYAQILFVIWKLIYKWSGLIYMVALLGGLIYH